MPTPWLPTAGEPLLPLLRPDWPAPPRVRACVTTRAGGVSAGPYATLNLGVHVGDDPAVVVANRARLRAALSLDTEPVWLRQVHGVAVARLPAPPDTLEADAAVASDAGVVCAILTADCLPVLFCADDGSAVGAAHAGWRGLLAGVLEQTLRALPVPSSRVLAWLGPAIGPRAFEVGREVRDAFVGADPAAAAAFASSDVHGKYLADLYALARLRLRAAGVTRIHGGGECTHGDRERFFSYRRDGVCGRMATLIWLAD
ncbi:MAG: peptidoglycan editing factor PgeF [Nevskiaceae bacterium]|nr:MAG: peptidoglycan editing factor PgeF [Nevskiaceae bacterium]